MLAHDIKRPLPKLIEYIFETDKVIGGFVEEDSPKSLEELQEGNREQLVNYLTMRVEYMKLFIDNPTVH